MRTCVVAHVLTPCLGQDLFVAHHCTWRASWPLTFWRFFWLCLLSQCRRAEITGACYQVWLYTGSGDVNLVLMACVTNALSTEPEVDVDVSVLSSLWVPWCIVVGIFCEQQDDCHTRDLCLLDAGKVFSLWCTMKNASGHCWMFPGGQSHPIERHW